jgi:peptidoglycan-N-acetylglucosamine deacetylase
MTRRSFLGALGRISIVLAGAPAVLALPAVAEAASSGTRGPIGHGSRKVPTIALTIDDGWGPANCRKMFEIVQSHQVPATFFPYGQAMHLDPRLWREISDAGYPLANHTNSHPVMTRLSARRQHFELTNGRHVAEQITGRKQLPIFRPPYGAWNATTMEVAHEAGFPTVVVWDTTVLDGQGRHTASAMRRAGERGTNGSILLMHGGPKLTPTILPSIINFYRLRGFRFVFLTELLGLPADGWPAGTGVIGGVELGVGALGSGGPRPAAAPGRSIAD